jgi:hypothetical protein
MATRAVSAGFAWSVGLVESRAIVAGTPNRYGELLAGRDGTQRHPDLS